MTINADSVKLREPGAASSEERSVVYDDIAEFDIRRYGEIRVDVSNITVDDNTNARLDLALTDSPTATNSFDASNFIGLRVDGSGRFAAEAAANGKAPTNTLDSSKTNAYVNSLNYLLLRYDGEKEEFTVEVSDGSTTVTVSHSSSYPTNQNLHLRIAAVDSSSSTSLNADFDIDKITVG